MAITRLTAPSITGLTIPNTSINNASLDSVTALPSGIDVGKIGQVVNGTYSTLTTISTSTFTDTGMSISITPTSSSSKIFVMFQCTAFISRSNAEVGGKFKLLRGSTDIWTAAAQTFYIRGQGLGAVEFGANQIVSFLDSPSTTSSTTYKLQAGTNGSGHNLYAQRGSTPSVMTLMEVLA